MIHGVPGLLLRLAVGRSSGIALLEHNVNHKPGLSQPAHVHHSIRASIMLCNMHASTWHHASWHVHRWILLIMMPRLAHEAWGR